MKKNLILGAAQNYSWYILEPFIRSFLKNVPNADLVLFVEGISDFTRNCIKNFGGKAVKLEPFSDSGKNGNVVNTRWKMFLEYLEVHGTEYEQVLVTDTPNSIIRRRW